MGGNRPAIGTGRRPFDGVEARDNIPRRSVMARRRESSVGRCAVALRASGELFLNAPILSARQIDEYAVVSGKKQQKPRMR